MKVLFKKYENAFYCLLLIVPSLTFGQTIQLKEAIEQGVTNYSMLTAKSKYAEASHETVKQMKREYLPNLSLSAQQDYGTVN